MRSMKSMLPFLAIGAMMSGIGTGGGANYLNPYEEHVYVPDKFKNIPKPLSKKQKAKLKKRS